MRRILTISVFALFGLFVSEAVRAQPREQIVPELRSIMLRADAPALASRITYSLEIAFFGEGRFYSRGQATLLLKEFFKDYPPEEFSVLHYTSTPSATFIEGKYLSEASTSPIRIYMRLRIGGGSWNIRELLIEQAKR